MNPKTLLRRSLREQTRLLSAADRQRISTLLIETLQQHPRFQQARHLMLYHSLPDEPCTHSLLEELRAAGRNVWLPVVAGDDLEVRRYEGAFSLQPSALGRNEKLGVRSEECCSAEKQSIELRSAHSSLPTPHSSLSEALQEPTGERLTRLELLDLIVVPGMAFTPQGERLGRGRGYYDRFLSQPALSHAYLLGLCWPHALLPTLPTEPHDVCVHEVVISEE